MCSVIAGLLRCLVVVNGLWSCFVVLEILLLWICLKVSMESYGTGEQGAVAGSK